MRHGGRRKLMTISDEIQTPRQSWAAVAVAAILVAANLGWSVWDRRIEADGPKSEPDNPKVFLKIRTEDWPDRPPTYRQIFDRYALDQILIGPTLSANRGSSQVCPKLDDTVGIGSTITIPLTPDERAYCTPDLRPAPSEAGAGRNGDPMPATDR